MIKLFFAGSEIPGWRTLLHDRGVRHMAMSFVGLGRRVKKTDAWELAGKFPADTEVFVESGAYTLNKRNDVLAVDELNNLIDRYIRFVECNEGRLAVGTEFDAVAVEPNLRAKNRDRLHEILQDRFLPIWHDDTGLPELYRLAETYGRVGVSQMVVDGRDITPVLLGLARAGTRLHGVAMTQIEAMRTIPWDSVSSTSWLSPSQYGDTIVWTGKELKRYPRKYAAQGRKRHRTLFTANGFDAEAIEAGDSNELLKLSIWSWNGYVDFLNKQTKKV